MYELKAGRSRIDKGTGEKYFLPSMEDPHDRLVEASLQFGYQMYNLKEAAIINLDIERLYKVVVEEQSVFASEEVFA